MSRQRITNEAPIEKYYHVMLNMADDDLDPYQYRLLGHYIRVGTCWQSTRTTAKHCKMSVGKVSTVRDELEQLGWIKIDRSKQDTLMVTVVDRMSENITRYQCSSGEHRVHVVNNSVHDMKQRKNTEERTIEELDAPSGAAAAKAEKPNTKGKEKAASAKAVSKWTLRECAAFEEGCSAALAALRAAFGHDTDMTRFKDMTVLEQRAYIGTYQELERVGVASTDYAALVAFARKDWPKLPVSQLPKYVTDWRQASKPKSARKYAGEVTTEPKTSKPEETPEERAQRLAQFRAMRQAVGAAS